MADYTEILDDELVPDAPIPSILGFRWRDNPIAIAEGAPNAPRIAPRALQAPGVVSGAISGTTWVAFTGLDDIRQIRFDLATNQSGSSVAYEVAFSADGGSTWGSGQTLITPATNAGIILCGHIDLVTGAAATAGIHFITNAASSIVDSGIATTLTVPANCNAIRFRFTGGVARTGRIFITPIGGRS